MAKKWKVGLGIILAGALATGLVACSSSQPPSTQQPQVAKVLFVEGDIVTGSGGTVKATASCVQQSQYKPGNQIVFRARVIDPATGQPMDASTLKSVTVKLADGQTFEAKYGGHPGKAPTDSFWATSWVVPDSYSTGSLNFEITAVANDGRTGTFTPFNVAPSLLTIVAA